MSNQYINFYYDPTRQGYDTTLWNTISGTPSISSGKLRLNTAKTIHSADIVKGDLKMKITVPAAPTSGDVRQFGFNQINKASYAYFDVTGAVFSGKLAESVSGTTGTIAITWESTWTNAATEYEIRWEAGLVKFIVNGVQKGILSTGSVPMSSTPMSAYLYNGNADNMDTTYVEFTGIQSLS